MRSSATSRRVLVVIPSTQRRGSEIQGCALAEGLARRGWDASVVAVQPGAVPAGAGLDVTTLARSRWSPIGLVRLRRMARGATVIAHGSSSLAAVAIATLGSRTRWIYRNIGDPRAWVANRWARTRTGLLMRRASGVAVLWPGAGEALRALYRMGGKESAVIPNDRDPEQFRLVAEAERNQVRNALGVNGPCLVLLGALTEEKQPVAAVEVVAALPGAVLLVAGEGPLALSVQQQADLLAPGRVRLLGNVADPSSLLAAADVVLLPSRTEGMPGVIIESLMRGVPVVATAVGAVPAMLASEADGRVVPVGDTAAMLDAVRRTLEVPAEASAGKQRSERATAAYTPEAALDQWEDLLNRVNGSAIRGR